LETPDSLQRTGNRELLAFEEQLAGKQSPIEGPGVEDGFGHD
jgi:hypothetical protein